MRHYENTLYTFEAPGAYHRQRRRERVEMSFIKRSALRVALVGAAFVASAASSVATSSEVPHAAAAPVREHVKTDSEAQTAGPLPKNVERMTHGRFQDVTVYHPEGKPKSFALFLSGDGGWNLGVVDMAQTLVDQGAMVVGIDTPKLLEEFEHDADECVFPDGDLENLSHWVQAYYHLPMYLSPLLVGYSSGATLAYAVLVQAPKDTFAGALSLGFCPTLTLRKPLCRGSGIESRRRVDGHGVNFLPAKNLSNPWIVLQGEIDQVCMLKVTQEFVAAVPGAEIVTLPKVGHGYSVPANWGTQFKAAFTKLATTSAAKAPPPAPAVLSNLPVIEIAARPGALDSDMLAVLMSGDGGWAGLDKNVAEALAARGIPVVGLDSLRYYWTPRTMDGAAADIDRLLRYYLAHWNKKRALLIGYSQGANVLPFVLNRLPETTRAQIALAAAIGLTDYASFEFHMTHWIQDDTSGLPTLPETRKISGVPFLCIYGRDESDSICPQLDPSKVRVVAMKGGHHFGGDYNRLAQEILASIH